MKKLVRRLPQSRQETASNPVGSRDPMSIVAPTIAGASADALMMMLPWDPAELKLGAAKTPRLDDAKGRATVRTRRPRHTRLPLPRAGEAGRRDRASGSSRR